MYYYIITYYYISMMLSAIPNSKNVHEFPSAPRVAHRVRLIVALLAVHLSRQDRRTRHHQRFQAVGHGELDQQHPNGLETVLQVRLKKGLQLALLKCSTVNKINCVVFLKYGIYKYMGLYWRL